MATRRLEQELEEMNRLREVSPAEALAALRKALSGRSGMVAGKAAKLAGELALRALVPDLLRAFDRLFENGRERDPQCWGKNGIAKALVDLGHLESEPYLRGARHIQMEPVWGGQEDTASTLRGICMLALAACSDVRRETILRVLVDGLADPKATVREEAVRAVVQMRGDDAALLLRLKAHMGDRELPVVGQVFDGILALEGEGGVSFLARFLDPERGDAAAEAALSLGASRLPGSLDTLEHAWEGTKDPELRFTLLRAMSASRETRAIQFLVDLVKHARPADVSAALDALSLHKATPEIRHMAEQAAHEAGTQAEEQFRHAFR